MKKLLTTNDLSKKLRRLSDAEVARLLRTSHQLRKKRNPRKRAGPGGPRYIPKEWTAKEVQMVGTDRDGVIAEKLGCTVSTVKYMRGKLGLRSVRLRPPWTEQEVTKK